MIKTTTQIQNKFNRVKRLINKRFKKGEISAECAEKEYKDFADKKWLEVGNDC